MGLFDKKLEKSKRTKKETEIELTQEELDKVTTRASNSNRDWCPKVDVKPLDNGELKEEELDEVTAGFPIIDEER